MIRKVLSSYFAGAVLFLLTSCGGGGDGDERLLVVATTGMVGDMVKAVGGDAVDVNVLMGAGIDPHSYKPKLQDSTAMAKAKIVFYSGLMLEGKMETEWQSHSSKSHAVASALSEERLKGGDGHPDPHVWGDVELWSQTIDGVVAVFSKHDPDGADGYKSRGEAYRSKLMQLHEWAIERAKSLPEASRVMVTSHDAFEYFGAAYGFQVFGLQGISTVSSSGAADRSALAEIIKTRKVKMIFPESSVNPAAIEAVAEDTGVAVSKVELFSDAMGVPGEIEEVNGESYDLGTYEGMIKHNMNALVEGLK